MRALRALVTRPGGLRVPLALAAVAWGLTTLTSARDQLADELTAQQSREGAPWQYLADELGNRVRFLSETVHDGCGREDVVHELGQLRLLHKDMVEALASVNGSDAGV